MLRDVITQIEKLGHQITSRWITDDAHNFDENSSFSAKADLEDIDKADAILLFVDQFSERPGKGKYVELGYAIGMNKKCFLYGVDDSCVFYHLPELKRIVAFEELSKYEEAEACTTN